MKDGELIPAKLFNHLVTSLQARQTLSQQNTPTLESLQMTLKQPLDASELAALSAYIQQKIWPFCAIIAFFCPVPRIFLISFINGGLKGLIRVICNRCLILFPPMMDTLQKYGNASRAVDTVNRDYPDAGLAGSLTPTK